MTWADAAPNLLIGLREGLEAGLVVSILLAALGKANERAARSGDRLLSPASVWLGVLGAVMVSGSFAAVLTYSTSVLSSAGQEAVGGGLSVLTVGLVTAMVFWMRRTARGLGAQLRGEVDRAAAIGAGALTMTAFLAVGREGLETTLFLWTAVKASGSTVAPLVGAGVGLASAVGLCWLLYRRAVRIDVGAFFNRTALALVVIAAGVLSYGLGDLQDAGLLPGHAWVAFDLAQHLDPGSWWVTVISGVTELTPTMTVLQVVAWIGYLTVVVPLFLRAASTPPQPGPERVDTARGPSRWERWAAGRTAAVAAVLIAVPGLVAGSVIALLPAHAATASTAISVTKTSCAPQWTSGHTGTQSFQVRNDSGRAGEVDLDNAAGAVVAEIETIGPATTAPMSATLASGQYAFACIMAGRTLHGPAVQLSGSRRAGTAAVRPVTLNDLIAPNTRYQSYAATVLTGLARDVGTLRTALSGGSLADNRLAVARAAWLRCQLDWERVGASYDSFGAAGEAVDGLPDGLPQGVHDPHFVGLHRIEYGLFHGQSGRQLLPVVARLGTAVAAVRAGLHGDSEAGDPTVLPLRVHEILEDALRDHLSGIDDEGSGLGYAETYADTQVTRVVLGEVAPLIRKRMPGLVATVTDQLAATRAALLATRRDGQWQPATTVGLPARQRVDATVGTLLESLSIEPDLLEVPPTH